MKVDFGGIGHYKNDVVTVNIDPNSGADIICDITREANQLIKRFELASIEQISCFHTLEHLPAREIIPTLLYWKKFLTPTGRLLLAVPDTEKLIRDYSNHLICFEVFASILFNCTPYMPRDTYNQHYWAWTKETLTLDLLSCGFKQVVEFGADIYPSTWILKTPGTEDFPEHGNYRFPNLRLAAYMEEQSEIHDQP